MQRKERHNCEPDPGLHARVASVPESVFFLAGLAEKHVEIDRWLLTLVLIMNLAKPILSMDWNLKLFDGQH